MLARLSFECADRLRPLRLEQRLERAGAEQSNLLTRLAFIERGEDKGNGGARRRLHHLVDAVVGPQAVGLFFGRVAFSRRDLQQHAGEALRIEGAAGREAKRLGIIEPAIEATPRPFHVGIPFLHSTRLYHVGELNRRSGGERPRAFAGQSVARR